MKTITIKRKELEGYILAFLDATEMQDIYLSHDSKSKLKKDFLDWFEEYNKGLFTPLSDIDKLTTIDYLPDDAFYDSEHLWMYLKHKILYLAVVGLYKKYGGKTPLTADLKNFILNNAAAEKRAEEGEKENE